MGELHRFAAHAHVQPVRQWLLPAEIDIGQASVWGQGFGQQRIGNLPELRIGTGAPTATATVHTGLAGEQADRAAVGLVAEILEVVRIADVIQIGAGVPVR